MLLEGQQLMKINEIAKLSGVNQKTIRYYEEVGVLPAAQRNPNGYREYKTADLERMIFIRRCRELQIPLKELKLLVGIQANEQDSCAAVDQIIEQQRENVRLKIQELQLLEKSLSKLAHSCQSETVSQCQILRSLGENSALKR